MQAKLWLFEAAMEEGHLTVAIPQLLRGGVGFEERLFREYL